MPCLDRLGNLDPPAQRRSDDRIIEERLLSDDWYVLKKTTFEYLCRNGRWQKQRRGAMPSSIDVMSLIRILVLARH